MTPSLAAAAVAIGLALLIGGCDDTYGSGGSGVGGASRTGQPPAAATASAAPASWVMPNLVGQNLQAAQDAIQKLTGNKVFLTSSTDASGQGRAQVLDANWQVCAQNVRPGETIERTTKIEFAAVKLDENCP